MSSETILSELKMKRRELFAQFCMSAFGIVLFSLIQILLLFLLSDYKNFAYTSGFICNPFFIWIFCTWFSKRTLPITREIRELKQQVNEAKSAEWRDKIINKIKSGQIKPA